MTEVHDSPEGWVAEHAQRYVETNGEDGHEWRGVPTLLLTTTGRKTGERRRTPLIYGTTGEDYVIVASVGGAPKHPAWYLNLQADPAVELQVGAEVFTARAHTADAGQRQALWPAMTEIWPAYDEYQARTAREIPIVVLKRL